MIERMKDLDNGTYFFNQPLKGTNNLDLSSSIVVNKKAIVKQQSTSPMDHYPMDRHGTMPVLDEVNFIEMAMVTRDSGASVMNGEPKNAKGLDQQTVKLSQCTFDKENPNFSQPSRIGFN